MFLVFFLQVISEFRARQESSFAAMMRHASPLLERDGTTVLTISKSSSVTNAICNALERGINLHLIVCESRPLCEGLTAATVWAQKGAQVTVITDAQAAVFIPKADVVLVGADAVTEMTFTNKASVPGGAIAIALLFVLVLPHIIYLQCHIKFQRKCAGDTTSRKKILRVIYVF